MYKVNPISFHGSIKCFTQLGTLYSRHAQYNVIFPLIIKFFKMYLNTTEEQNSNATERIQYSAALVLTKL